MALLDLSVEARSLPEQLETLAKFGSGVMGTVVVDTGMLTRWATAARELRDAVEDRQA